MSSFDGTLVEYPFISIDRFDGHNLKSSLYFLSHCHKDHIEGLLDNSFLQRLQTGGQDVKFYCSETTRNLMLCDPEMKFLTEHVIGLPVNQSKSISIKPPDYGREQHLVVTLISAGHCVGSVMFMFEGGKGTVVYTGDFRLGLKEIEKVPYFRTKTGIRDIKSLYVDTTFCCPSVPELPTREITKDCLIGVISSWIQRGRNYVVHLKCKGRYGYEYIMREVAKHFKQKIHVNNWRVTMCSKLPDMLDYFTTNPVSSQIHCCYYGKGTTDSRTFLPCNTRMMDGKPTKMITIVPSSLHFVRNGVPDDNKLYIPSEKLWRVVHSMHASYNEIRAVVGYLKPKNIYPCVPPADCQDILQAYCRLEDLRKETSCDSQSSCELNDEIRHSYENGWRANLQRENMLSPRSASVRHVELGLCDREELLSPPPRRRKRKQKTTEDVVLKKHSNFEAPGEEINTDEQKKHVTVDCDTDEEVTEFNSNENEDSCNNAWSWSSDHVYLPHSDSAESTQKLECFHVTGSTKYRNDKDTECCECIPQNRNSDSLKDRKDSVGEKKDVIYVASDSDGDNLDSDSDKTLSFTESLENSQVY